MADRVADVRGKSDALNLRATAGEVNVAARDVCSVDAAIIMAKVGQKPSTFSSWLVPWRCCKRSNYLSCEENQHATTSCEERTGRGVM